MTDAIQRINLWLTDKHGDYVDVTRRLVAPGSLFAGLSVRYERENAEHDRRMKELNAEDDGMADTVYGKPRRK